jgi:hypothetical protein
VIGGLALTVPWLLAGTALAGAAYWGLLLTPESSVWSLGVSALLALLVVAIVAVTVNAAVLAATRRGWSREVIADAVRRAAAGVPPLLLVVVGWWLVSRGAGWVESRSGEISAWFIATLDWPDVRWIFTAVRWLGGWLKWIVIPLAGLVWLRTILTSGWRPTSSLVRQALSPTRVLVATAAFALLVWVPWAYLVPWRPANVPLSAELVFVAAKLGLAALLAATGIALVIRSAASDGPVRT